MKKVFVTGASGFIGQSICKKLSILKRPVTGSVRGSLFNKKLIKIKYVIIGDIAKKKNWENILAGYDCIVHCAGRAHKDDYDKNNIKKIYESINLDATKQIVYGAVRAKVKRLIFMSTIGVLGTDTNNRASFKYSDKPKPIGNYSISKYKAERFLNETSKKTDLEVVIIRAPLVYGYGAPGNLARLIKYIRLGIPMPFRSINNKRSFIGIDNLVDVIIKCIDHRNVAGKTFLVSDGKDISTPDLIKLISLYMNKSTKLFSIPFFFLKFIGFVMGKKNKLNKLTGSLQINNDYICKVLNWKPKVSVADGIKRMIQKK